MAGTRTAPTVDGSPVSKSVSIGLIDAQGDVRSISLVAAAGATNAQIEALVAAVQAATNASVWRVTVGEVYNGAESKGNAANAVVESLYSNIVYHVKESATSSQRAYIPAPLETLFNTDTDQPDPTDALLTAWFTAVLAVVGNTYTGQSIRYTERREINDSIKL